MIIIPQQTITRVSTNVTPEAMGDKMFDAFLNTQTEFADVIEVEIEFNNCDRVALFNIDAYSIHLELTDDDTSTVVQTKTIDLDMGDGEYQQWVIEPLYIYADATLKITLNKASGTAKCGLVGIGLSTSLGITLYSPDIGFTDYSIKDTNDFSQTYLKQGAWAKRPSFKAYLPLSALDAAYEDLVSVRGTLPFFEINNEGKSDYESLRVHGFIEDWSIKIDSPAMAELTFTIQGVI